MNEEICKVVGQLFLESRLQIERLARENEELKKQNEELVRLLHEAKAARPNQLQKSPPEAE